MEMSAVSSYTCSSSLFRTRLHVRRRLKKGKKKKKLRLSADGGSNRSHVPFRRFFPLPLHGCDAARTRVFKHPAHLASPEPSGRIMIARRNSSNQHDRHHHRRRRQWGVGDSSFFFFAFFFSTPIKKFLSRLFFFFFAVSRVQNDGN